MTKKLANTNGYKTLVSKIRKELGGLELLIKRETVLRYWRVGRYISEHLLKNRERATYGDHFYQRLAQDTGRDKTTLTRAVQFYRTYPIVARRQQLSWRSYRLLLTVKDDTRRRYLEKKAIQEGWKFEELNRHIKPCQKQKGFQPKAEIPQLPFIRGQLNSYRLLEPELLPNGQRSRILIDLGFRMRRELSQAEAKDLKPGDCLQAFRKGSFYSLKKISIPTEELFTYVAKVQKIIDADTLWALIDCGFGSLIQQKLRLRGIDAPELSTPQGQRAKRFVQEKLRNLDFIVIKSYKDTVDKYDRYLVDLFYLKAENNPQRVLAEGIFLNQELLDKGLAKLI